MKYVKVVPGKIFGNASRDKREIQVILELGYEVTIISSDREIPSGFERCSFVPDGFHKYEGLPFLKRWACIIGDWKTLISIIKREKADYISGHDILALGLAYCASRKSKKKQILIYDSHELEMGRNSNRSNFKRAIIMRVERYLSRKSDIIIIPCESAAEILQTTYRLKEKPLTIRSTPNKWNFTLEEARNNRIMIRKQLGFPLDAFIICYHGNIVRDRGIENMLKTIAKNDNVFGLVLGNALKEGYRQSIIELAYKLNIMNRVIFHEAVPFEQLWKYLVSVDVGIVMIQPTCQSYYLALPNKLFENIQALNPIIASNLPELRRHVAGYDIGMLVDYNDDSGLDNAVEIMRTDAQIINRFKNNLLIAKEELCWEKEKNKLNDAVKKAYD